MSGSDTDKHLTSWAGLCPQNAESAGKKKATRIGKACAYIKPLLTEISLVVSRSSKKHPGMYAKYKLLQKRRGGEKPISLLLGSFLLRFTTCYQRTSRTTPSCTAMRRKLLKTALLRLGKLWHSCAAKVATF